MRNLKYENYSLIVLLLSLLLVFLLYPFFSGFVHSNIVLKLFISVVVVAAVIATTHRKFNLIVVSVLGAFALGTSWCELYHDSLAWVTVSLLFDIFFLGYVVWVNLVKILTTMNVTKNLLFGAICIYLLIGLLMSFIYVLIDLYYPNSFNVVLTPISHGHFSIEREFFHYIYFSFVTLTTLGYGDIRPVSQPAQAFAYMEAIAGQFYLTVLVARLIGLNISNRKKI
jgi:voltage-gated potassium channel